MKKHILLFLLSVLGLQEIVAQKINEAVQYHIKPARGTIAIDGKLDDAAWQQTELGKDFWMITTYRDWETDRKSVW